jgi:hypothetical protein
MIKYYYSCQIKIIISNCEIRTTLSTFLRERAIQEGNLQGEQRLVIRLLNRRLGEIDSSLIEQVNGLSIEQLESD